MIDKLRIISTGDAVPPVNDNSATSSSVTMEDINAIMREKDYYTNPAKQQKVDEMMAELVSEAG